MRPAPAREAIDVSRRSAPCRARSGWGLGTTALVTLLLAGCALSPRAEMNYARDSLYRLCGDRSSVARCPSLEASVAAVVAAAGRHPDDAYAQGQAVFALTRSGALVAAQRVVDGCSVEGWWCTMLQGHVAAESGKVLAAERAFDHMIAQMPEEVRCKWTDLSWILPDAVWGEIDSSDCLVRVARSETIWWLSDPSHLLEGSEAKVVHYNRVVLAALHDDQILRLRGRVADGTGHSLSHHRSVLRRGMPDERFDRAWERTYRQTYSLIPDSEALLAPTHAPARAWRLGEGGGSVQTEVDLSLLDPLPSQVAFFERGDSILVTAAIDLTHGPVLDGGGIWEAAMILGQGPEGPMLITSSAESRDHYVFRRSVPWDRYLVSLEAITSSGLARTRFGNGLTHPSESPTRVSDLLLFSAEDLSGVESLDEALPTMRGGTRWTSGERVGLYLEVYGPSRPDGYDVSVSLTPRSSVLGRIGRVLGFESRRPVEVTWRNQSDDNVAVVSFTVALANVEPGDYVVEVTVETGSRRSIRVSRQLRVLDGDTLGRVESGRTEVPAEESRPN